MTKIQNPKYSNVIWLNHNNFSENQITLTSPPQPEINATVLTVLFQMFLYQYCEGLTVSLQYVQCVLYCLVDGTLYILTYPLNLVYTLSLLQHITEYPLLISVPTK